VRFRLGEGKLTAPFTPQSGSGYGTNVGNPGLDRLIDLKPRQESLVDGADINPRLDPLVRAKHHFATRPLRGLAPVFGLDRARRRRVNSRRYSATELAETAAGLQRLLDAIAHGEVTADSGTVSRLEGAIAALEALSGGHGQEGLVL
jgi:hypothetical protein